MSDSERTTIEGRKFNKGQNRPEGRYAVHNRRSDDPQNAMPARRPPNSQNPSEWEDRTVVDDEGNSVASYITTDANTVLPSFGPDDPQRASNPTLEELTVDDSSVALPAVNPLEIGHQMMPDAMAKLVVIDGNDLGRKFDLNGQKVSIGRGLDNSVVLTDIAVSRKHLCLEFQHGRYLLIDMGSGNGTLVNGELTRGTYELIDGDVVEIGKTRFRFDHLSTRGETRSKPAPNAAELSRMQAEAPRPPAPAPALPPQAPLPAAKPRPEPPLHLDEQRLPPPYREDSVADQPRYSLPPPASVPPPPASSFGAGGPPVPRAPEPPRRTNAALPAAAKPAAPAPPQYPGLGDRDHGSRYPLADEQAESFPTTKYGGDPLKYGGEPMRSPAPTPVGSPFMKPGAYQTPDLMSQLSGKRRLLVPLIAAAVALVLLGGGIALVLAFTGGNDEITGAAPSEAPGTQTANEEPAPDSKATEGPGEPVVTPAAGTEANGPTVAKLDDKGKSSEGSADSAAKPGDQQEVEIEPDVVAPGNTAAEAEEPEQAEKPGEAAASRPKQGAPERPRGPNVAAVRKRADTLYRQKKFGAAASALREAADAAGGKVAKELRDRAALYESVGEDLDKAKASSAAPTAALSAYKRALGSDRSVGGGLSSFITGEMGSVAAKAAKQHFDARRYEAAMSAAEDAQRYGAGGEVAGVRKSLEDKAQELYKDAMRKKSTSPEEAQSLFQRILKMVPPSSEVYKKAYKQVHG